MRTPRNTGEQLTLRCFGSFEVCLDGRPLDQWPRRKGKLILAALALRPAGCRGPELIELLTHGRASAASTLNVSLSALRRTLEPNLIRGDASRYVQHRDERFVLEPSTLAFCDLREFEAAMAEGETLRATDARAAAMRYEAAMALMRGHLFEDDFLMAYFEAERQHYRRQALAALAWLAEHHQAHGGDEAAEASLKRAVALAPCEEETYTALMRLYRRLDRPERVKQSYWDCRKALKARLGLRPSETFEKAYHELAEGLPSW